ncbi:sensor histidine kinase [Allostreptomyces psammosilenae]|uniref:histidine kinase n=1 Tax=Allostreptomyces psammosilenae TaxID=1892865 RepID=A0A853A330_9ACTN|nr:HAMP domain-containing sensor histidine kinase [Allostreptomyces psammosilenae]NYI04922.1 two-component system OmpR family sensor kinase [Allostreptomyces psammosilenae]
MRYAMARRPGRSLRIRLVAATCALLAAVCATIGLVTTVALNAFLAGRLDAQLAAAADRSLVAAGGSPPAWRGTDHKLDEGVNFLLVPGQAAETLGARISDGVLQDAAVLDGAGTPQNVPAEVAAPLLHVPVDGRAHTRTLEDLGEYRVQAVRTADGDVVITGLSMDAVRSTVNRLAAVEVLLILTGLIGAGFAGDSIIRRALRPLRRVAATAVGVTQLRLDRGEVADLARVPFIYTDPETEVGQVGAALNRLLDHVGAALTARHASELRVRRFVADASHELRTPLAAISGYAQLTRRGDERIGPRTTHALCRIESEAARMTSLVEDLLLLARLDAGRPLEREEVDLARLAADAVGDAHAAAPDREWRLELPGPGCPVTVLGDATRLHQVLANLLGNARSHTPPGTRVTTEVIGRAGEVMLRVADDGPGIPADLLPHVFERFARADSSRSRAAGSTGLGLSIVAAVVHAHGGHAEVTSRPGRTAFTVYLPAAPPRPARRAAVLQGAPDPRRPPGRGAPARPDGAGAAHSRG